MALGAAVLLTANAAMAARSQGDDSAAKALVSKALAASDIEAEAAPALRLEARIRSQFDDEALHKGKLLWVRTRAGWRHEELTLAAYRSVRISDGNGVWTKSTEDYLPFSVFLAERAANFLRWLREAGGEQLSGPQTSAATGETCVKTVSLSDPLTYCFDPFSGNLSRVADTWWNVTFRYSEYVPFGARSFPRLMEVVRSDGNVLVEIHVVRLAKEKKPDSQLFLPVKGAKKQPAEAACGKIVEARLLKMVQPNYPAEAARAGIIGVVKLYADIGADGVPRGMWLVNSASPVLGQAAVNAVRQWRYQPRTCETTGEKLPQVQNITVVFSPR
ncbi:MAG TPA: energy transducer TonB [Patescibacteria group bacterium]|nr:energy transducer TonB [Patescibacteria group bacterium]